LSSNNSHTKKSKIVPVTLSISLLISGCSFQNGTADEFKLTRVMDSRQVKPLEVLSFSCETITARPTEITTYCADFGISITSIRWKSWTANGAVGTGTYLINNCNPNCAAGKFSESPVGVKLEGLYTDGERYFLRYLTFTGDDNLSLSEKIEGMWDLAEFYLETPAMRSGT
jgi:hypothetical protein